jgi:hypothetical protein
MLEAEERRRSLVERIGHARELVERLDSAPERLTDGAWNLLDVVKRLLDELDEAVERRWERLEVLPPPERESYRRELCDDFRDVLLELGGTYIPTLEGASASSIPVELETTVQTGVFNAAPGWDLRSILYGTHHYNYSIGLIRDPLGKYESRLGLRPTEDGSHRDFAFISMPRLERSSMGLHAVVLGHELGHLRNWYENISDGVDLPVPDELLNDTGQVAIIPNSEIRSYLEIARNWAAEVVADIFSYLVLGPASILSLAEFTSTLGPVDADLWTHPAPDRRLRLMLDLRAQRGPTGPNSLDGLLDRLGADLDDPLDRPVELRELGDQTPCRLAWQWLRSVMPSLVDGCARSMSSDEMFTAELADDVDTASQLLAGGRPAGELLESDGTPRLLRTRVILNGVWQMKASRLDGLATGLDMDVTKQADLRRTCAIVDDLAAKSLEIAAHRRDGS